MQHITHTLEATSIEIETHEDKLIYFPRVNLLIENADTGEDTRKRIWSAKENEAVKCAEKAQSIAEERARLLEQQTRNNLEAKQTVPLHPDTIGRDFLFLHQEEQQNEQRLSFTREDHADGADPESMPFVIFFNPWETNFELSFNYAPTPCVEHSIVQTYSSFALATAGANEYYTDKESFALMLKRINARAITYIRKPLI